MFLLKDYLNSFFYKTSQYSQAGQDIFAQELFGESGVYIDVGSGEPAKFSNTYLLEVKKKWKGFGVDIGSLDQMKAQKLKKLWTKYPERKNKIYWEDAVNFNYKKALSENNLSNWPILVVLTEPTARILKLVLIPNVLTRSLSQPSENSIQL